MYRSAVLGEAVTLAGNHIKDLRVFQTLLFAGNTVPQDTPAHTTVITRAEGTVSVRAPPVAVAPPAAVPSALDAAANQALDQSHVAVVSSGPE